MMTDEQAMNQMLEWGIPIIKAICTALKMQDPVKGLGMVINTLIDKDADHIMVVSGCVGAIAGFLMATIEKQEGTNEPA